MQRWALILSGYSYKIEFIPSSANACADCLSRLPVPSTKIHPAEKGNEVHATNCVTLPITAKDIANLTARTRSYQESLCAFNMVLGYLQCKMRLSPTIGREMN